MAGHCKINCNGFLSMLSSHRTWTRWSKKNGNEGKWMRKGQIKLTVYGYQDWFTTYHVSLLSKPVQLKIVVYLNLALQGRGGGREDVDWGDGHLLHLQTGSRWPIYNFFFLRRGRGKLDSHSQVFFEPSWQNIWNLHCSEVSIHATCWRTLQSPVFSISQIQSLFSEGYRSKFEVAAAVHLFFKRVKLLAVLCFLSPQAVVLLGCLSFVAYYYKRHKWSVLKSRKIVYRPSPHSWRVLWSEKIEITFTQIVSAMNDNKNLLTFWSVPYSLVNAKVLLSAPSHVPVFFFELLHRACLNAICWADCYFAVHDDYWFFVLLIPRAYLLLRKCCEVHVLVKGIITFCFVI